MAVIQKTLFSKNLTNYSVLVNDTQTDSKYFKITQLPDTFTGGKNAFLIAGSEELMADTRIQIELKDAAGLPSAGVYALHNAVDVPALLPTGKAAPTSISNVLQARGDMIESANFQMKEEDEEEK